LTSDTNKLRSLLDESIFNEKKAQNTIDELIDRIGEYDRLEKLME
jgi:hypothetical protein